MQREDEKGSPSVVVSEHGHELDGIHDGLESLSKEERASVTQREDEKGSPSVVTSEHGHELDGIHDGLEFPTEEERATLRRVSDTIPWNAYRTSPCSRGPIYIDHYFIKVIAVVELAERFSVGIKLLVCSVIR